MNNHERHAWRTLIALGAKTTELGGKHALDLRGVRVRSAKTMARVCSAIVEVVGRSGANRRHVDRNGDLVFVVTDDKAPTVSPT